MKGRGHGVGVEPRVLFVEVANDVGHPLCRPDGFEVDDHLEVEFEALSHVFLQGGHPARTVSQRVVGGHVQLFDLENRISFRKFVKKTRRLNGENLNFTKQTCCVTKP